MTKEQINDILVMNEQLASDVRQLSYKVSDLVDVVELLTKKIVEKSA
jgi:hypothetical protein